MISASQGKKNRSPTINRSRVYGFDLNSELRVRFIADVVSNYGEALIDDTASTLLIRRGPAGEWNRLTKYHFNEVNWNIL